MAAHTHSTAIELSEPTPAEVANWVKSSLDITGIRIAFEGSVEFYFRTTGFMP